MIKLIPKAEIHIREKSGKVNLAEILGRPPDVVDRIFEQFFATVGEEYSTKGWIYLAHKIIEIDSANDLPRLEESEASDLCAALSALKDSRLLDIPEGKSEIEIVLGVVTFDGVEFVLLVEHEFKCGSDQIHCHSRELWNWGNDDSILLTRKKIYG